MSPWYAKAVVLAGTIVMMAIRAPHGQRSRAAKVVKDLKGRLEKALLAFVSVGFLLPLVWLVAPVFAFADYDSRPAPLVVGTLLIVMGLWLFYRSHADLGTNWSISLEVRERHRLVSGG